MSTLFTKINATVENELLNQLSQPARNLFPDIKGDNNLLYRVAENHPGVTPRDVAIIRQINDFGKKFIGDGDNRSQYIRDLQAWNNFKNANERARVQSENFENLDIDVMETLERARVYIAEAFWASMEKKTSPFLFSWSKEHLIPVGGFSSGPGICTDVRGKSLLEKFSGSVHASTVDGIAYLKYLRKVSKPFHDLPNFAAELRASIKATFVPKDLTRSRLIAPQLNGDITLQYPACNLLEDMLNSFNIDLSVQQMINREMARKGSLFDNQDTVECHLKSRSVRFCTIDLVSASDIVGINLVKFLLPPPLFNYLMACAPTKICWTSAKTKAEKEPVELFMMATMGNAFCFPLQTIVFASIVKALYSRLGLLMKNENVSTFSVYGDDIIVDITAYKYVIKTLESLNMQPNQKKSFSTGFFRESCGADFFNGYDVRPICFEKLSDDCDKYSLLNRLLDWGARHYVSFECTTLILCGSLKYKCVVPMDFSPHRGLRVPEAIIPLLSRNWKKNMVCSSLIDKSIVFQYFAKRHFTRTSNVYQRYQVRCLEREARKHIVDLKRTGTSLLPFLRGGIRQLKEDKFLVPGQGTRTFETVVDISFWDVVTNESPKLPFFGYDLSFFAGYLAVSCVLRSLATI